MLRASAVALVVLLAANAGGASAATGTLPDLGPAVRVTHLPAGGTYIAERVSGSPVAAVELWYRAPSTGFGATPLPTIARLAAQVVAASKPLVGQSLGTTVDSVGGRLTISVYTDSIAIAAIVPASAAPSVVRAMTTSYFAPVVTGDGYKTALHDVAREAALEAFNPETLLRDAIFAELFASGPQHYPPVGEAKAIGSITLEEVRSFATRAFRSQNAVLVVNGAIDPAADMGAVSGRPASGEATGEAPEDHALPQPAATLKPVVKSFAIAAGGYGWIGPPIADEREATAMDFVADYLFRNDSGYVSRQLNERFPDAFVSGQFITLHDPGVMFVAYVGQDLDSIRKIVDDGFALVAKPLPAATFAAAREAFRYRLLSDLQTPTQIADNFGWYAVEGNPQYAPGTSGPNGEYFKAIESLTPEFVASVVGKYLAKPPASVTLHPQQHEAGT